MGDHGLQGRIKSEITEGGALNRPSLTIVIPALNEEQAIASTIERCLAAREVITAQTDVRSVELVVVSDGSTDRTEEIARSYSEVHVIVFPYNRGYGAAIQAGWQARPNELLAFLDADGTCEPTHFTPMCNAIIGGGCDIVVGSRMSPDSQMSQMRRIGNRLFALLLSLLSHQRIQDAASGMRVLRRSVLPQLMPLPGGLHFTPAISTRALLEDLRITEIPITYKERIGRSKLNVFKDGLRFLCVILETVLYTRPSRLTFPLIAAMLLLSAGMMVYPVVVYVRHHDVEEWMMYRFLLSGLLVLVSTLLLSATYIIEQLIAVSRTNYHSLLEARSHWWTRVNKHVLSFIGIALALFGIYLAWPAILSYLLTQKVNAHWSRIMTSMFCELLAAQVGTTLLLSKIILGVVNQQAFWLRALNPKGESEAHSEKLDH